MAQTFETGFRTTLSAKLSPSDTTVSVATAPTVTSGRMHIYKGSTNAWIKYTGVTGTTLTGVSFVSQTADPATTVTGTTFPAGTSIELVEMHDQMLDKQQGGTVDGTIVFNGNSTFNNPVVLNESLKVPVYADATARDAAITVPANGMEVYLTAEGQFYDYQSGAWGSRATGTSTPNASTTASGKVEIATNSEAVSGTETGGTGAILSLTPRNLSDICYFGDGSDGNVTISVNTSLIRDMYYNNLTVNTGVELNPAGYAVYVLGTLTLTGTAKITRLGNNGGNASAGTAGTAGTALATGTCGPVLGGVVGATGATGGDGASGGAGVAVATSYATTGNSVAGGAGGNGGAQAGGTGGATAAHTQGALYNKLYSLSIAIQRIILPTRVLTAFSQYGALASSGSGGAGGSNGPSATGGGGGGSGGNGGIILVFANVLSGTGTIEAKGGNGGNGGNAFGTGNQSGGGGGGSGGCGGIIYLVYRTGTLPTFVMTGGTGGTGGTGYSGGGTGSNGTTGTTGTSIVIQV